MATTYATSSECGEFAGRKTIGTNTRPTTTTVDQWRLSAYVQICTVIGFGTSDLNNVAKVTEMEIVKIHFDNLERPKYRKFLAEITDEQIARLQSTFSIGFGIASWIPGKNTRNV